MRAAQAGTLSLGTAEMEYDPTGGVTIILIAPENCVAALSWHF